MDRKYTIFYAGLETKTLQLFVEDNFFEVLGCGEIDYLHQTTFNPFNLPLKYLYYFRTESFTGSYILETLLRTTAKLTKSFSSSYYKRYASHILYLSEKNIRVYEMSAKCITSLKPDVIIVNVWDMLPSNVLNIPTYGTINIHPSKLPQYRGAVPTLMSLKNNDTMTAVSYMLLSSEMDKGGIIFQHPINIVTGETALTLEEKIYLAVESTFLAKIKDFLSGEIKPTQQDESLVSYTPKHEEYRLIDPKEETANDIINKVLLYPFLEPDMLAYLYYKKCKVHIGNLKVWNGSTPLDKVSLNGFKLIIHTRSEPLYARLFCDIDIATSLRIIKTKLFN